MAQSAKESHFTPKDALEHAWDWFQLHATHRMQLVNYFLLAAAFISTGYATALTAHRPEVALAVAILGIIMSVSFGQIEVRVRELLHAAEPTLIEVERLLTMETGISVSIVKDVESPAQRFTSYSSVISVLHRGSMSFFGFGVLYALWVLIRETR